MVGFDGIFVESRQPEKFLYLSWPYLAEILVDTSARFPYKVALDYSVLTVTRGSAFCLRLNFALRRASVIEVVTLVNVSR